MSDLKIIQFPPKDFSSEGTSPEQLLETITQDFKAGELTIDKMLIIALDDENKLTLYSSRASTLEAIGILEVAKSFLN